MAGAYERGEVDSAVTAKMFVTRGGAGISSDEYNAGKRGKGGRFPVVGVTGLYLRVTPSTKGFSASWMIRLSRGDKETSKAVKYSHTGGREGMTLKDARIWANEIRAAWRNGVDLVKTRREERKAKENALPDTVSELFPIWHESFKNTYSRASEQRAIFSAFKKHLEPELGKKRPDEVRPIDVAQVLKPLALAHRSVFVKARMHLESFFRWCEIEGIDKRSPDKKNPAAMDTIRDLLPPRNIRAKTKGNPTCSVKDLRRLVRMLVEGTRFTAASAALLFQILTAVRINNVTTDQKKDSPLNYAVWEDIDLTARTWSIPAEKLKKGEQNGKHVVPLSTQAIAILERMKRLDGENQGAVFRTPKGTPMYQGALRGAIQRADEEDRANGGAGFRDEDGRLAVPHGIARACFRTWGADKGFSSEALEVALHHKIDEKNYNRSTKLEARREIMQAWADEIFRDCPEDWADVKP